MRMKRAMRIAVKTMGRKSLVEAVAAPVTMVVETVVVLS